MKGQYMVKYTDKELLQIMDGHHECSWVSEDKTACDCGHYDKLAAGVAPQLVAYCERRKKAHDDAVAAIQLKRCPFCGAKGEMNMGGFGERYVTCSDDNCGGRKGGGIWARDEVAAARLWNYRPGETT